VGGVSLDRDVDLTQSTIPEKGIALGVYPGRGKEEGGVWLIKKSEKVLSSGAFWGGEGTTR